MTSIHARIPASLRQTVDAARRRGEEDLPIALAEKGASGTLSGKNTRPGSTLIREKLPFHHSRPPPLPLVRSSVHGEKQELPDEDEDDGEEHHDESKENDPSQALSPIVQSSRSARKNVLGKRPLSELPTTTDPDEGMDEFEKNIAVHHASRNATCKSSGPARKAPKLAVTEAGVISSGAFRGEKSYNSSHLTPSTLRVDEERENGGQGGNRISSDVITIPSVLPAQPPGTGNVWPTLRKVLNIKDKTRPRIGIRRL
jgi:ubiquitin-conjugating enzyme E2 S